MSLTKYTTMAVTLLYRSRCQLKINTIYCCFCQVFFRIKFLNYKFIFSGFLFTPAYAQTRARIAACTPPAHLVASSVAGGRPTWGQPRLRPRQSPSTAPGRHGQRDGQRRPQLRLQLRRHLLRWHATYYILFIRQ